MSHTRPRAPGQPSSTPCADSRASSSPGMIVIVQPGLGLDLGLEILAVAGFAHGGGGHHGQAGQRHVARQQGKAADRRQRTVAPLGVQAPRLGQIAAQPAEDLFVEEIRWRTRRAVEHHHADRVRADVDHPHAVRARAPHRHRTADRQNTPARCGGRRHGRQRGQGRVWGAIMAFTFHLGRRGPSRPRCGGGVNRWSRRSAASTVGRSRRGFSRERGPGPARHPPPPSRARTARGSP